MEDQTALEPGKNKVAQTGGRSLGAQINNPAKSRLLPLSFVAFALFSVAAQPNNGDAQTMDLTYRLGAMDKVRVKVLEWRASRDELFQWPALNDDYTVDSGGKLSLPIVGEVVAAGLGVSELSRAVGERLRGKLGLSDVPDISIDVVGFRPFYILGDIDRPGEFAYRPGLTVLKAVSIAGGMNRKDQGVFRLGREMISGRGQLEGLALERTSLIGRHARLEAELRFASDLEFPSALANGGESELEVVHQETALFRVRHQSLNNQLNSLQQQHNYLAKELQSMKRQLANHDEKIVLARNELSTTMTLLNKGFATQPRRLSAQQSLFQLEGDRLRLESEMTRTQRESARIEFATLELRTKFGGDAATELQLTRRRISEIALTLDLTQKMLVDTAATGPQGVGRLTMPNYSIVRIENGRAIEIQATETATVQPGDTIKVALPLAVDAFSYGLVSSERKNYRATPLAPTADQRSFLDDDRKTKGRQQPIFTLR